MKVRQKASRGDFGAGLPNSKPVCGDSDGLRREEGQGYRLQKAIYA